MGKGTDVKCIEERGRSGLRGGRGEGMSGQGVGEQGYGWGRSGEGVTSGWAVGANGVWASGCQKAEAAATSKHAQLEGTDCDGCVLAMCDGCVMGWASGMGVRRVCGRRKTWSACRKAEAATSIRRRMRSSKVSEPTARLSAAFSPGPAGGETERRVAYLREVPVVVVVVRVSEPARRLAAAFCLEEGEEWRHGGDRRGDGEHTWG